MIVTTTKFGQHHLILIANTNENSTPQLVEVNWLLNDKSWRDSKSFDKIKKHYVLNDDDFKFIDKNDLSSSDATQSLLLTAIEQLNEYADGRRNAFDLPLDISLGTEFQQQVWQALQGINHGETISYATLAKRVGNPKGFRAVANANGKNPFSIIVPCHRVIASDGKLGGYTGGLDKKRYLLELEGSMSKF
ncbi:methylated-DNA--[protein]-cysteine S-methyltransferase [Psychrobacter sp. FBL11]|uniref:Methylated-DNA--protein-cysteine methyltransferase n=1 Tax=Psychrobacter saeujeotis TaxID=3143436 RepID=A0ABU9X6U7_9GAMM|nr:methylated-DNA--[protein]-cysteine S-methyltransferase [uncultured Psychrobacter sp.]